MLKALAESQGTIISERYWDMIHRVEDTRSGDEIAADIIIKAGLKFKES